MIQYDHFDCLKFKKEKKHISESTFLSYFDYYMIILTYISKLLLK